MSSNAVETVREREEAERRAPGWRVTDSVGVWRPMVRLAGPVLLEQILILLVGMVDLWLAGKFLLQPHLAAIGLMAYLLWMIPALFSAISIGATALIARFAGGGNFVDARRATNQAMLLGAALSIATMIGLSLAAESLVAAMQFEGEPARLTLQYLWIVIPFIPAMMIEQVGIACLRGAGNTVSGFVAMGIVNVLNTTIGAGLVTGWGPFPEMGWAGLAWGTAVGYTGGAIAIVTMISLGVGGLSIDRSALRPDPAILRRLLRVGLPGGLDMLLLVACHLWFLGIVNALGELQAAAHGLAVRIEGLAYVPGVAFQVAASTMAGQYLGAGDVKRARRSVFANCFVAGMLMSAAGLVFFLFPGPLTSLFLGPGKDEVAATSIPLLRIVSLSMPFLAVAMVASGALRGSGDTRVPLFITLFGFLAVRIPLAYWLAWAEVPLPFGGSVEGWGLAAVGAWYAMVADLMVRGTLLAARFLEGSWSRVEV